MQVRCPLLPWREAAWPVAYITASPSLRLVLPYEGSLGLTGANLDPCLPPYALQQLPGAESPCGALYWLQLQPANSRHHRACWPLTPGFSRALGLGGAQLLLPALPRGWACRKCISGQFPVLLGEEACGGTYYLPVGSLLVTRTAWDFTAHEALQ